MDIASVFSYDPSYSDFEASLDGHQFGEMNCSPLVLESGFKGGSNIINRVQYLTFHLERPLNTWISLALFRFTHPASRKYLPAS